MIIGLSGYATSGKDETAMAILRLTDEPVFDDDGIEYGTLHHFSIKKFSYKLKLIASILTGIPAEDFERQEVKDSTLPTEWDRPDGEWRVEDGNWLYYPKHARPYTVREFLQDLGTDAIRDEVHTNAWVNALMADYNTDDNWIITDVRFPNEAQAIKDRGGAIIRVSRPGVGPKNNHPSETALDSWEFDGHIENDGTIEELAGKVKDIINKLWTRKH